MARPFPATVAPPRCRSTPSPGWPTRWRRCSTRSAPSSSGTASAGWSGCAWPTDRGLRAVVGVGIKVSRPPDEPARAAALAERAAPVLPTRDEAMARHLRVSGLAGLVTPCTPRWTQACGRADRAGAPRSTRGPSRWVSRGWPGCSPPPRCPARTRKHHTDHTARSSTCGIFRDRANAARPAARRPPSRRRRRRRRRAHPARRPGGSACGRTPRAPARRAPCSSSRRAGGPDTSTRTTSGSWGRGSWRRRRRRGGPDREGHRATVLATCVPTVRERPPPSGGARAGRRLRSDSSGGNARPLRLPQRRSGDHSAVTDATRVADSGACGATGGAR